MSFNPTLCLIIMHVKFYLKYCSDHRIIMNLSSYFSFTTFVHLSLKVVDSRADVQQTSEISDEQIEKSFLV